MGRCGSTERVGQDWMNSATAEARGLSGCGALVRLRRDPAPTWSSEMSMLTDDEVLSLWFEFWTADGWLWCRETATESEEARNWYPQERAASEWIDIGGSD